MTSLSVDDRKGRPVRSGYGRNVPIIIAAAVLLLLAVGAFLLWGPIGLGNGPVDAGMYAAEGNVYSGRGPARFIITIHNSGSAPAVIDGVGLTGGTRYPAPHLLRLGVVASSACGGAWPAYQADRGFALTGCGGPYMSPLMGARGWLHELCLPRLPGRCRGGCTAAWWLLGYEQDCRPLSRGHQALRRHRPV